MTEISKYVVEQYNKLVGEESLPINEDCIKDAIHLIDDFNIKDSKSLFTIIAALNLLNAAIKNEDYKSILDYGYIKSNVSKVLDSFISNEDKFGDCEIFYDMDHKCLYFKIFDVVFGFHQVKETTKLINIAGGREPIIWPGIRLQRIAQSVYEYGKKMNQVENTGDTFRDPTTYISASKDHMSLRPCPDCGKMVSFSAKFCPNCGFAFYRDDDIVRDLSIGNSVRLSYNGLLITGIVEKMGSNYLELSRENEPLIRIKYNSIETVELLGIINTSFSHAQTSKTFIQQIENNIKRLYNIEGIKGKDIISTNSTITQGGTGPFTVIMDDGRTVTCTKMGCVSFGKKKIFLSPDVIGKRVYCGNLSPDGICRCSIVEMTYGYLLKLIVEGVTKKNTKARNVLFAFISYLNKFITKPEAYLELKEFEKNVEFFFGKFDVIIDSPEDDKADIYSDEGNLIATTSSEVQRELYNTETEKSLLTQGHPQIKVVGKIDLDTLSERNTSRKEIATDPKDNYPDTSKPSILSSEKTWAFLNKKLVDLSESRCKALEKELDKLIREGQKEECLKRSYKIITESRPTPKYLRSYLDRIVNTEIALDHTEEALQALAYLIAYSEKQGENNANTLGHWYITMSRLFVKTGDKDEAYKAILYADKLKPNNSMVNKLMTAIRSMKEKAESGEDNKTESEDGSEDVSIDTISNMLLQDIEQEAHRQELLPGNELVPAEQLLREAQDQRDNQSKTNEEKASLFLETAAAYYNNNQTETNIFKASIAYYALFKGHGMFAHFANLIRTNTGDISDIHAYRDSASSYYIEALVIFNALGEKEYLQEIFLKYLQMAIVVSNIEGGKTPADDWENWTLKQLQLDCLKADSMEERNALFNACISVGTAAEGAWNTLYQDKDGLYPFISRFGGQKFRDESYRLFNELAGASVSFEFQPGAFMHGIFEHRQLSINELHDYLKGCLNWPFSTYAMSTFEPIWNKVVGYKDLMTTTDKKVMSSINDVIEILKPYASRVNGDERTRSLASSQQLLYNAQKIVSETTTFYGKTFYSHLIANWLDVISRQLDERNISSYPKLEISPEPCYIKTDDDGLGFISFVVSNTGDSTAQSYIVEVNVEGKIFSVSHDSELTSGDCSAELVKTDLLSNIEHTYVQFNIIAKYRGKDIPPVFSEATYEKEPSSPLTDENQIPWHISNTPEENVFKGREEKLSTLVSHYLSKDRSTTYILYGLTRTGKSSILDYLCERINKKNVKENTYKKILTFKWDLSKIPYKNSKPSILWTNLLETRIYECLPEDLAHAIVNSYPNKELPSPDNYNQMYLRIIINTLNNYNYIPLITIDEFSYIRKMLEEGLVDATFIKNLRDLALEGKACFVYAGTYDIKDLPKEKDFGLAGVMNNTTPMHINEIEPQYANELIDACPYIFFDKRAKDYIRALSGCVPWWIQWICLGCGKYALAKGHCHLGYKEVDDVVKVLTEEVEPAKNDTWADLKIAEENFDGNQIDINNIAEQKLITCISYLIRESTQIERGVSMDELKRLWNQYNVNEDTKNAMVMALSGLEKRKIIRQFRDEERVVYRLNVDLFRRWWYAHHRDLNKELLMN